MANFVVSGQVLYFLPNEQISNDQKEIYVRCNEV